VTLFTSARTAVPLYLGLKNNFLQVSQLMKIRESFNGLSHFAGAAVALPAVCLLLVWGGGTFLRNIALCIYGLSLVGMLTTSGIYHSVIATPAKLEILRKLDHAAIYLLIAGTYTPFCLIAFSGFWRWGMLTLIWSLALVGIAVKVFIIRAPRWVTAGVYLVMGWISLLAVREMLLRLTPVSIGWLLTGGILYTLGAIIYTTRKADFFPGVFGFHEVWHIFVLLATAAHFVAVASIL
jgi:hemolysin III